MKSPIYLNASRLLPAGVGVPSFPRPGHLGRAGAAIVISNQSCWRTAGLPLRGECLARVSEGCYLAGEWRGDDCFRKVVVV